MRLKPKTVRRLLLLSAVVVMIGAGAAGAFVLRHWQRDRIAARYRAEGLAAAGRGASAEALEKLDRYLRRRPDDAEAQLAFARAWSKAERFDGSHLEESIRAYRRYLGSRPDDREAQRELLALYGAVGRHPEARDLAARSRPARLSDATRDDLVALRAEAAARAALADFGDELGAVVARLTELEPLDLDARLLRAEWLVRRGRDAEARQEAEALARAHPEDPRAGLATLLIGLGPPDPAEFERLFDGLCGLTALDPDTGERLGPAMYPDETYALRVAALFDQLGRHDHALGVLRDAADASARPGLFLLYVRRAWQRGATDGLHAAAALIDESSPGTASDLLGFKALALLSAGPAGDAGAVRRALKARADDFRAGAWDAALDAVVAAPADPMAALGAAALAVERHPAEPVFRFLHAETLAAFGRLDEAIGEWRRVASSPLSVGWARPWVRLSQAHLELGRIDDAVDAADRASRLAPRDVSAALAKFDARIARLERADSATGDEAELLRFAEEATEKASQQPDAAAAARFIERLLPGHVLVLARTGQRPRAATLVRGSLSGADPFSRETLERVALVSLREGLGVEDDVLLAAVAAHGNAPSTAAARASVLRARGRAAEGLAMLRAGAEASGGAERRAWGRAVAVFMDQVADPGAAAAWIALADSDVDDLTTQMASLRSPSATRDAEFVSRAATRIARLTGAGDRDAPVVRLARARAHLSARPDAKQRDEAVRLLRGVTTEQPQLVEGHLLLADALLVDDPERGLIPDLSGALTELRAAAQASPEPGPVWLRAAALMQRRREFPAARDEALRLIREHPDDPDLQEQAAGLLLAQGDADEAIPIFESLAAVRPTPRLLLAKGEALARARRDGEALTVFRDLALDPPEAPDQAVAVAVWLDRLGERDHAEQLASALAERAGATSSRDVMLARFEAARGQPDRAIEHLRRAVAADPKHAEAWDRLVSVQTAAGRLDEAVKTVAEARRALPDDARLRALEAQVTALGAGAEPDLAAFANALAAESPMTSARTAVVIRAVAEARASGTLDSETGLAAFAERFADQASVQNLVVRRLLSLTPPKPEAAAQIAERAMSAFPMLPEPARLAAAAHGLMGRWDRALAAAEAWRRRDPSRPVEADAAVAEANLRLGAPSQALAALSSRVERAKLVADSPQGLLVLGLYTRAQVMAGQVEDAYAVLASVLDGSSGVRTRVFLPLVVDLPSGNAARQWLDRASAAFEGAGDAERAARAGAYIELAQRHEALRVELLDRARSALLPLETDAAGADVLEVLGRLRQASEDPAGAAEALRRALAADPARVSVIERLVEVLLSAPGGAAAALDAAQRFADSNPGADAWAVLARAHAVAGEAVAGDDARRHRTVALDLLHRSLAAQPDRIDLLLRAATVAEALGDVKSALAFYERGLALPALPAELRAPLQNNAAYAMLTLGGGAPDLRRARSLARSAATSVRNPAFFDTLGRIEAALGSRTDAVRAFRDALAIDPVYVAGRIGLARVLADGSAAEAGEARALLSAVDADVQAGRAVISSQQRLEATRIETDLATRDGGR
ncbi:MAG: tetratricopeptide repeat protein [Phycisphaerales bacterium]